MPIPSFLSEAMLGDTDQTANESLINELRAQKGLPPLRSATADEPLFPSTNAGPWIPTKQPIPASPPTPSSFVPAPDAAQPVRFLGDPAVIAGMTPEEKAALAPSAVQPRAMTGGIVGQPQQSFLPPPTVHVNDIVNRDVPVPVADYSVLRESSPNYVKGATRSDVLKQFAGDMETYNKAAVTPGALSTMRAKTREAEAIANGERLAKSSPSVLVAKTKAETDLEETKLKMAQLQKERDALLAEKMRQEGRPANVAAEKAAVTGIEQELTPAERPIAARQQALQAKHDQGALTVAEQREYESNRNNPKIASMYPSFVPPSPAEVVTRINPVLDSLTDDVNAYIDTIPKETNPWFWQGNAAEVVSAKKAFAGALENARQQAMDASRQYSADRFGNIDPATQRAVEQKISASVSKAINMAAKTKPYLRALLNSL